jgi:hypothetical protein
MSSGMQRRGVMKIAGTIISLKEPAFAIYSSAVLNLGGLRCVSYHPFSLMSHVNWTQADWLVTTRRDPSSGVKAYLGQPRQILLIYTQNDISSTCI